MKQIVPNEADFAEAVTLLRRHLSIEQMAEGDFPPTERHIQMEWDRWRRERDYFLSVAAGAHGGPGAEPPHPTAWGPEARAKIEQYRKDTPDVGHACAPDWRTVPGSNTALCRTCGKSADVVLRSGPSAGHTAYERLAPEVAEAYSKERGGVITGYEVSAIRFTLRHLTNRAAVADEQERGWHVTPDAIDTSTSQPTPERQESERERLARQNEDDDGF